MKNFLELASVILLETESYVGRGYLYEIITQLVTTPQPL